MKALIFCIYTQKLEFLGGKFDLQIGSNINETHIEH